MDGGPENQDVVKELCERYRVSRVQTSAYNPKANGMIKRGHAPVVQACAKLQLAGRGSWVDNLAAVLWADRITVQASTGVSPYRLVYGSDPVLPVDLDSPTWLIHNWAEARTRDELLHLRAMQLQRRDDDLAEIALHLRRMREAGKEVFDSSHVLRPANLKAGDLVLLHDTVYSTNRSTSQKLAAKWLGPYRIHQANLEKGNYVLAEVDSSVLSDKTIAANRLKKYR